MNNGKFVLPGKLESLLCAGGMEFYSLIFRNIKLVDTFGRCHQIVKKTPLLGEFITFSVSSLEDPGRTDELGSGESDEVVH